MQEAKTANVGIAGHEGALSSWLDLFRWLAAFLVLLSHVRHRYFVGFERMPPGARRLPFYMIGVPSSFGAAAVVVFFVLSGFLVGGTSLRRYRRSGTFNWQTYAVARLTRLWTVLLPVFAVTWLLNVIAVDHFGAVQRGIVTLDGIGSIPSLVCNAAFLQTAACGQFGGNAALWSLFNEFWYYVAWPFVMVAVWGRGALIMRGLLLGAAVAGLLVLAHFQFLGPNVAAYFALWLLGVWAADWRGTLLGMRVLPAAAAFLLSLLFWRVSARTDVLGTEFWREFPIDLLVALAFANLILAMRATPALRAPPLQSLHLPLAAFSFTLYCVHTPLLNFMGAGLLSLTGGGWQMVPVGTYPYLIFLAVTVVCVLAAFLLSIVTERQTPAIRRLFDRAR